MTGSGAAAAAIRGALEQAIAGVLAALVALADPEVIVVGGPWGRHPAVLDLIAAATARLPRPAPVRAAEVTAEPSLAGARLEALSRLRSVILASAHQAQAHPSARTAN